MLVFNPGVLPEQYSMLIFHALAHKGIESLVLVSPQTPLVSLGYFQDLTCVNLDYCREHGLSVMRRELGGGTTLLDHNQIFYQIILKKGSPLLPLNIDQLYRKFSQPVIECYRELGVETRFKPINDIITGKGRKISGEGGGDIGNCIVFVGGILLDFDFELMSKVLRVPDEKFRDKLYKTMKDNLSTLKAELGCVPDREQVIDILINKFQPVLGDLTPADIPGEVWALAEQLGREYCSEEYMNLNGCPQDFITIGAGVKVKEGIYKAAGGLIQSTVTIRDQEIIDLSLTGDFTCYPKSSLAQLSASMIGTLYDEQKIQERIAQFLSRSDIEIPGVSAEDLCRAIFAG